MAILPEHESKTIGNQSPEKIVGIKPSDATGNIRASIRRLMRKNGQIEPRAHSLIVVADSSPKVNVSEDDHGNLFKAILPEINKNKTSVTGKDKRKKKIRKENASTSSRPMETFDAADAA